MKKFSKKLFCLMLVAIMVVAAIPFGAFADEAEYTLVIKVDGNSEQCKVTVDPAYVNGSDMIDALYLLRTAGKTDYADKLQNGTYELDGVVRNSENGKFGVKLKTPATTPAEPSDPATPAEKYTVMVYVGSSAEAADVSTTQIDKTENATTALTNAGLTKYLDTAKYKVESCSAVDATHVIAVRVSEVTPAPAQYKYNVVVKTSAGAVVESTNTVTMTKEQAEAYKTLADAKSLLNTMGGKYAECASKLSDELFQKIEVITGTTTDAGNSINVWLTADPFNNNTVVAPEGEILVVFDNGSTTTIKRDEGVWYFSTSKLGYDDTWGTEQATLRIYDANGYRDVKWKSQDSDAYIKKTDYKVEVKGINKTVTIYFLKSSTANPTTTNAYATKYYEANTKLGTLPALPAGYTAWYVDGKELTPDTVYTWETKYVYAYPGNGDGNGRVHLFIYNKNNELLKNVDVTESVQANGLISRSSLVSTIEYQVGRKNLTLSGLYTESGWAYYLNNKNSTAKAQASVDVGKDGERQGTQNLYVVLTNVSGGSTADTSNPKTGDTAMIGTATIVMVLAAAGMGTAFYMKKKELF